jgi:simple sugar transport system permease protein
MDGPAALRARVMPRNSAITIASYVGFVVLALAIAAFLVAVTGGPWRQVTSALLDGALRKPGRWGDTLTEAAPLLLVALGAIISTRAGLVNIGQEGQLLFGAACATFFLTRMSGPGALVFGLVVGGLGGALWAGVAALLRYWRRVPEVITTLLLVFIAAQLTGYALTKQSLLLDRAKDRPNRTSTSAQLTDSTRLPRVRLFGNEFPVSVVIAVLLSAIVAVALTRTVWGFRLRMVGENPRTAQRAGVGAVRAGSVALVLGGGLAGLAGTLMLSGGTANYRYTPGFSNNVGWEGLLVALVARNRPLVAIPVAFVFAMLRTGSGFLAATGVEREIVDVVRGLLVLALLLPAAVAFIRSQRRPTSVEAAA